MGISRPTSEDVFPGTRQAIDGCFSLWSLATYLTLHPWLFSFREVDLMNPQRKEGEEQGIRGSQGKQNEAVLTSSAQFAMV